ncbi:unnamed protein product [Penicillium bialowiezense]
MPSARDRLFYPVRPNHPTVPNFFLTRKVRDILSNPIPFESASPIGPIRSGTVTMSNKDTRYRGGELFDARVAFPEGGALPFSSPTSYDLRKRAAHRACEQASWVDDDQDEDYEPAAESSQKRKRPSPAQVEAPAPPRKVRMIDGSKYLNLKVLNDTTQDESSTGSASEYESDPSDQYWNVDPNIVSPNDRYLLRQRQKDDFTSDHEQGSSVSPSDVSSVSEDVPVRECKACTDIDMVCSLTADPDIFAYPCQTCADDGMECVVTPEPKWKRPCETCKDLHGEMCSYRFADYDHSLPCLPCSDRGFNCVAGPARSRPSIYLSDSPTNSEASSSPYSQDTTYYPDVESTTLGNTPEAQESSDEGVQLEDSHNPKEVEVIVISDDESDSESVSEKKTARASVRMKARQVEVIEISDDESDDEIPKGQKLGNEFEYASNTLDNSLDELFEESENLGNEFEYSNNTLDNSLDELFEESEKLGNEFEDAHNSLDNSLDDLFEESENFGSQFKDAKDSLDELFEEKSEKLGNQFDNASDGLDDLFEEKSEKLGNEFYDASDGLEELFQKDCEKFGNAFEDASDSLDEQFEEESKKFGNEFVDETNYNYGENFEQESDYECDYAIFEDEKLDDEFEDETNNSLEEQFDEESGYEYDD